MLQMKEEFVNVTEGHRWGGDSWYHPYTENKRELFRACQKEWGGCVSKVYQDTPDGTPDSIGWVFSRREKYEDCEETYVREVWVTFREITD